MDGRSAPAEIQPIIEQIRGHWPQVRITLRGDSGFGRDELMTPLDLFPATNEGDSPVARSGLAGHGGQTRLPAL
jgi:hypothetical protein